MISTSHITQNDSMADFFSMDCTSRGDLFAFFNDHDALKIPIIALTAVTIDENLDEFYKAGFNEIIPKPFKPEDFFEKISYTLKAS